MAIGLSRVRFVFGSAALLLACAAGALRAQGSIRGTLVDEAGLIPISAGRVELLDIGDGSRHALVTDSSGRFFFSALENGVYQVRARRIGYVASTPLRLRLREDELLDIEIRLAPQAVLLAPISIVGRSWRPSSFAEGLEFRRRLGLGSFIDRNEIERRNPFYVTDILGNVPGVRVMSGGPNGRRTVTMTRALRGRDCQVQVYVDGFLINRGSATRLGRDSAGSSGLQIDRMASLEFTIDEVVTPSSVEAIEVYRGPSEVPAEFAGPEAQCGVIAVWTRTGAPASRRPN